VVGEVLFAGWNRDGQAVLEWRQRTPPAAVVGAGGIVGIVADELAQLVDVVAEMRSHRRDLDAYIELDAAFHQLIATMTHNVMMYHLVRAICETIKNALQRSPLRPMTAEQLERVQVEHEAILTTLENGDIQAADRAMASYFNEAIKSLLPTTSSSDKDLALITVE
jgi:DNA-binding FadR family transcriptional regulator